MVMQDSDLNWTTENGEDFLPHIMGVWAELIDHCGYHPCVCTMVCENEPIRDEYITERPAPQMEEYAFRVISGMPIIRGSGRSLYTHSGDSHNYTGSLYTHVPFSYLDNGIRDTEKLNTEFGMDCPAEPSSLRQFPELSAMLSLTKEKYEELSEYQYRILKYYIEAYRIRKYNNCAGYIQFLFSDPAPQSFFGIVDFWGMPKKGYQALAESNGLYAAILEHDTVSRALWVINDSIRPLNGSLKVYLNRGGIEKQTAFYTVTVDADSSAAYVTLPKRKSVTILSWYSPTKTAMSCTEMFTVTLWYIRNILTDIRIISTQSTVCITIVPSERTEPISALLRAGKSFFKGMKYSPAVASFQSQHTCLYDDFITPNRFPA